MIYNYSWMQDIQVVLIMKIYCKGIYKDHTYGVWIWALANIRTFSYYLTPTIIYQYSLAQNMHNSTKKNAHIRGEFLARALKTKE